MIHKEWPVMVSWACNETIERLIQRVITRAEASLIFPRMAINEITRRKVTKRIWPMYKIEVLGWEQSEAVLNESLTRVVLLQRQEHFHQWG